MDRHLRTPHTAFVREMQDLKDATRSLRSRTRYPGAVHQTSGSQYDVDFTSSSNTFELARVEVEPGRWSAIGRAAAYILQTVADPNVSGKEQISLQLLAFDLDGNQVADLDTVSAQLPFTPLAGHAGGQMLLPMTVFGTARFEGVSTVRIYGFIDNIATEDQVAFRSVNLMAMPF